MRDNPPQLSSGTAELLAAAQDQRFRAVFGGRGVEYVRAGQALHMLNLLLEKPPPTRMLSTAEYGYSGMSKTMIMPREITPASVASSRNPAVTGTGY